MNVATILLLALFGVTTGFEPMKEDPTRGELQIQLHPQENKDIADPHYEVVVKDIPQGALPIGKIRVFVGTEQLPQIPIRRTAQVPTGQPNLEVAPAYTNPYFPSYVIPNLMPTWTSSPTISTPPANPYLPNNPGNTTPVNSHLSTTPSYLVPSSRNWAEPNDAYRPFPTAVGAAVNPYARVPNYTQLPRVALEKVRGVQDFPPAPPAFSIENIASQPVPNSGYTPANPFPPSNPVVVNNQPPVLNPPLMAPRVWPTEELEPVKPTEPSKEVVSTHGATLDSLTGKGLDLSGITRSTVIAPNTGGAAPLEVASTAPQPKPQPEAESPKPKSNNSPSDQQANLKPTPNAKTSAGTEGEKEPEGKPFLYVFLSVVSVASVVGNFYQWGTYESIRRRYLTLLRRTGEV